MILPNLIIAGAPKCGTTSLFTWLADHPDVCGASVKETRFLLDPDDPHFDSSSNYHVHGLAGYEAYFRHCGTSSAPFILEATPDYLYQETAPKVLASLEPVPDILFVLRKPSDRVYSHYQFARNDRAVIQADLTFREFVSLARGGGPHRDRAYAQEVFDHSFYFNYLGRWLDRFPSTNVHVFVFEELKRDPQRFARGLATEIGIDPDFYDGYPFRRRNPSYRVRWHGLHSARRALGRRLPPRPRRILKRATQKAYARLNVRGASFARSDEENEVLEQLDREFRAHNELLSRELRIDLSAWD